METKESDPLKNLLKIPEATKLINNKIAEKTLRNWRDKRMYPGLFVKIGGKVFVDVTEFTQIIEVQKEQESKQARRLGLDD
jgi:hypothetical protein